MSDVPIFDPNGIVRDIPYEQMKAALAAGGKPGVRMQAPDGKIRVVPASMTQQAAQAGGKLLPIEEQAAEHPGFWGAVAEDAVPALKGVGMLLLGAPGQAYSAMRKGLDEINSYSDTGKTTEQLQNERQKADNRGAAYRLLATPLAQGVGVNVPGMEASAQAGDQGGVLGHAAVPAAMAAAPLVGEAALRGSAAALKSRPGQTGMALAKGAAKVADVATFDRLSKAANAIKSTVGELGDIWNPKTEPPPTTPSTPPAPSATSAKTAPIYRDATINRRNIPDFAGEEPPAPKSNTLQTPLGKFSWQATKADIEALPKPVGDIVDAAVPKSTNPQVNLATKGEVALKLKMGDVAGAEKALDQAAAKITPTSQFPPDRPAPAGNTEEIRAAQPEARKLRLQDTMDDAGVSQEMNANLEAHGKAANSEAIREFIARNSTGTTKGELVKAAGGKLPDRPVRFTKTPGVKAAPPTGTTVPEGDMTSLLKQSLKKAKMGKAKPAAEPPAVEAPAAPEPKISVAEWDNAFNKAYRDTMEELNAKKDSGASSDPMHGADQIPGGRAGMMRDMMQPEMTKSAAIKEAKSAAWGRHRGALNRYR